MMAAAMVRHGRPFRNVRSRIRHESGEEGVKLDLSKDPGENVKEILTIATVHLHVHKTKKLGYLNAFVKLLYKLGKEKSLGYSKQDILCCLRVSLFHEAKEVRAATLRVLRYFIQDGETLDLLYKLHMDYLIVRSIDMCLDNEVERIHAIKLVRRIAQLAPHRLTCSLIYPLVAIGNDGAGERDRMVRVCLSTICEIAFLNPELIAKCGGIGSILRAALDCHQYPRINESLVCTILHLLNHPRTRHLIKFNTDLEQLLAPFTDCHYRYSGAENSSDQSGEDKENRFSASKMAIVSIMRSWPGIIRFCRPDGTGLQSLVGILYLPYYEIRQGIIEILYDLFRLQIPEWTDNFSTALLSVDPSMMRDSWRLTDGFICEEGRSLLPHMAKIRPNLVENHLALLLSAWIGAGILDALVEVVISSEDQLFVRTTILLGQLMHMASTLLPNECSHHSHCLPTLMAMASATDIPQHQQHRACKAVSYLDRLHSMKKRGIIPCSLYLDHLIQNMGGRKSPFSKHFHQNKNRLNSYYITKLSSEDMVTQTVKDSQVLYTKDNYAWDWDLIGSILKWPLDKQKKMDEQMLSRFMKRLIYFFKPTNHLFSRLEVGHKLATKIAHAGCLLTEFLMECVQEDVRKHFVDLINDIGQCLSEVSSKHLAAEAVLSPSNTINTCSQFYFLFLGKISVTAKGDKLLEKCGIYQYLLEIVSTATQDSFVKLTVSCLSYNQEGNCRAILSKALCASSESARLYCTKFLRVLLRVRVPGFSTWGMELLTTQLYDQSRSVSHAALGVMEEACEVDTCLNSLIKLRPSCLHLGEKGRLLTCRFMSTSRGFRTLMDANYISNELEIWAKTFDTKYVSIVEELLNEALTTYEKTFEGSFSRRSSRKRPSKDAFLPVHLYGQLTQTKDGFQLLRQQECVEEYFQCIRCQELMTDEDNMKLKTALWAVGHIGSSTWGIGWLDEERLFPEIIRLAEECGVFSIRGTAFYVLGLLASTREGAELLTQLGWESCWHSRGELWPVVEDRAEMLTDLEDANESILSFGSMSRSETDFRTSLHSPGLASTNLFFIAEEDKSLFSDGDKVACDNNHNQSLDTTNIPDTSKSAIIRSKTLPFESSTYRRYNSMPSQARNIKKFSRSSKQRTFSDDCDRRSSPKDPLSPVSPSDYIPLASEFASQPQSTLTSLKGGNSEESTVIPVICLPDDSSEPEPGSTEKEESAKDKEVTDSKVIFRQEGFDKSKVMKRSPIFRDGRSSSSESSRSSKNRADSFNTDSTTSGVSSCESGPNTYISSEVVSLSPIASSTSLNTVGVKSQQGSSLETKDLIHPSSVRRKSMNLNRVPSLRKMQGNPAYGILSSSRIEGLTSENAIMYTTSRDAYGYATWRSIKRQRTVSSDLDSDLGISNLYDEEGTTTGTLSRKSSVDSKLSLDLFGGTASRLSLGMTRNASGVSLSEMDGRPSSPMGAMPKASLQKRRPHTGESEFLGLTLPVDINMMFEVHEGEDKRSQSISMVYDRTEESQPARSRKVSSSGKRSRTTSLSTTRGDGVTVGSDHDMSVCVACYRLQSIGQQAEGDDGQPDPDFESDGPGSVTVIEREDDPGSLLEAVKQQKGDRRTRLDSLNELSSATPGSMNSCTTTKKMSFDSVHGRALIRQEIRKLVTNLSSSVGVKGSEQGLLGLKQKFPKVFQDVCFYSEVSHIMTVCSFRLTARRFIQELFDEFDITKLLEEARCILGVVMETENTGPVTNKQDTLDSVWENMF
ncbi:rapamycin-insensitive companion of mTOR-like isoform X2 [Argopecten irradians]|uniref:rapamycin-insensitive companion of mTOR-like isoform X2 n=1 Tax=Argopecten irradians TaxID=31199 RepID=UPI00371D24DB